MAKEPFRFTFPLPRIVNVGWATLYAVEVFKQTVDVPIGETVQGWLHLSFPDFRRQLSPDPERPAGNTWYLSPTVGPDMTLPYEAFAFTEPFLIDDEKFKTKYAFMSPGFWQLSEAPFFETMLDSTQRGGGIISGGFTQTAGPFASEEQAIEHKADNPELYADEPPGDPWTLSQAEDGDWYWQRFVYPIYEDGTSNVIRGGYSTAFIASNKSLIYLDRKTRTNEKGTLIFAPLRIDFGYTVSTDSGLSDEDLELKLSFYSGGKADKLNSSYVINPETGQSTRIDYPPPPPEPTDPPYKPRTPIATGTLPPTKFPFPLGGGDDNDPEKSITHSYLWGQKKLMTKSEADAWLEEQGF